MSGEEPWGAGSIPFHPKGGVEARTQVLTLQSWQKMSSWTSLQAQEHDTGTGLGSFLQVEGSYITQYYRIQPHSVKLCASDFVSTVWRKSIYRSGGQVSSNLRLYVVCGSCSFRAGIVKQNLSERKCGGILFWPASVPRGCLVQGVVKILVYRFKGNGLSR